MLIHRIFVWQTLIGAFLGAITPLAFWFFTVWRQRLQEYKDNLNLLEKLLLINLNAAFDNKRAIIRFIEKNLDPLIILIEKRITEEIYSTDVIFFPLFFTPSGDEFLKIKLRSNYIANKVLEVSMMSNNYSFAINDVREQFKRIVEINTEMGMTKLNPPKLHNQQYLENMKEYKRVLLEDIVGKNIKAYIKEVQSVITPVQIYTKMGNFKWERQFSHKYKFFKNKTLLEEFKKGSFDRLEKHFKEQVDLAIKSYSV